MLSDKGAWVEALACRDRERHLFHPIGFALHMELNLV